MKGRLIGLLVAGSAMLVLVAVGAAANTRVASGGVSPALLTYVARDGGLCVVREDGTHAVRLTPRSTRVENPSWSPDGRYVAFDRSAGYQSYSEQRLAKVVVADARGHAHSTFGTGNTNRSGFWSPDGRHMVYFAVWAHWGSIVVARPDGSDDHSIATNLSSDYGSTEQAGNPAWTPDGQRLVFDAYPDPQYPMARSIFSVAPDGTDRRLLLANAETPAYSPDGSKLAYVALDPHGAPEGVVVAQPDGSDRQLISSPTVARWRDLAWSPDGTAVAIEQQTPHEVEIVVARADGSGERVVATVPGERELGFFGWSPDGKLIAFEVDTQIFVVRPDGSGKRVLVTSRLYRGAAWRPAVALPRAKRAPCPLR